MFSPSMAISPSAADVDGVIHAVQATQERRLAAARRTDEGGHGTGADVDVHVLDGVLFAVIDLNVGGEIFWSLIKATFMVTGMSFMVALPYQRRSNLRRRMIAMMFMARRKQGRMMILQAFS